MADIQKPDNKIANVVGFIQKGGEIKPFIKDIHLLTVNVAGLDYIDNIDEIFTEIKKGDKLELYRESTNKFDKRAILVKYNGEKIGYVPKNENKVLASLMDAGKYLYGVVVDFGVDEVYENYPFRFLSFEIYLKEDF